MADQIDVQVTGKTKEEVAYIMTKHFLGNFPNWSKKDRGKVLDLYAECLEATSGDRNKPTPPGGTVV